MNVRHLLARKPADIEAERRQLEKEAAFAATELPGPRHGRRSRKPGWLIAFLERRNPEPKRLRQPEQSGRARHLAYRAAKRRAASR